MKKILRPFLVHCDLLVRFLYSRCPGVRDILHKITQKKYVIDGNYALSSFRNITGILKQHNITWDNASILELGPGSNRGLGYAFLAHSASSYIFADKFSRFDATQEYEERAFIEKQFSTSIDTKKTKTLLVGAEKITGVADNSIDIIINVSVFEHVKDVQSAFAEMYRVLKPGGVAYCSIDPRDHYLFDYPYLFLKYSEKFYTRWLSAEGYAYTNRWQYDKYNSVIDALPFERLWESADQSTVPLPSYIHPEFQQIPSSTLTISRIQYLLQKKA